MANKPGKEYYFIFELKKPNSEEANDKVDFTNLKDKNNAPKCILTKEEKDYIIKIFKFNIKLIKENKASFEFFFNAKKYKVNLDKLRDKTFIFDASLESSRNKIEQKINLSEKMNYFFEAMNSQKEKLSNLYLDSIALCNTKSDFTFLINIFVKLYNTDLCSKILDLFNKNIEKFVEKLNKENLQKYKFDFDTICENKDEIISKFSLNKTDFYGLVLCYWYFCKNEKFRELFDSLYKNDEIILFEVLFKYKLFFKGNIELDKEQLNKIIEYSAKKKDFKILKEDAFFYLKDINTFLDILEGNQDAIINMKGFESIEIPEIKDDEEIKFGIINPKIESITNFSKESKKLFIILRGKFWESLSKKCSEINKDNIELCSTLRILFNKYNSMIMGILPKENSIRKEINKSFKKGIFTHLIDKIKKEYIKTNKITNIEIIDLIKDYDVYYSKDTYANKREPEILEKIDLDEVNESFIQKFKEMKFEKLFERYLSNFLLIFTNKVKKISDFDVIFKLININELGSKKENYLKQLKNKYNIAILSKAKDLSEKDENLIKNLVNLTIFLCTNENKIEFLDKTISKSPILNAKIKHKIYIELIKFCKDNKNDDIKKFIINHYKGTLKPDNLNEFIDLLINLSENDANEFIENIDNKYYVVEKDFYSKGINLNIRLLN